MNINHTPAPAVANPTLTEHIARVGIPWGKTVTLWDLQGTAHFVTIHKHQSNTHQNSATDQVDGTMLIGKRSLPAVESPTNLNTPNGRIGCEEFIYWAAGENQAEANIRIVTGLKPDPKNNIPLPRYESQTVPLTVTPAPEPSAPYQGSQVFSLALAIGQAQLSAATAGESFYLVADDNVILSVSGLPLPNGEIAWRLEAATKVNDPSWANSTPADDTNSPTANSRVTLGLKASAKEIFGDTMQNTPEPKTLVNLARPATMAVLQLAKPWIVRIVYLRPEREFN